MILLILCALLAGECKVHRAEGTDVYQCTGISDGMGWSTGCDNPAHWFPCTVVEKCDTVYDWNFAKKFPEYKNWAYGQYDATWIDSNITRHYNWTAGLIGYSILCHPETTLVDSGVIRFPSRPLRPDEVLPDGNLTPAGLADLRDSLDMVLQLVRRLVKSMPTEKTLASLRHWSQDFEYKKCIDTLNGLAVANKWFNGLIDSNHVWYSTDTRRYVRDSCECVYGQRKDGK